MLRLLRDMPSDRPVLIAGPTASGKSALALALAEAQGGVIVNADALQVFDAWKILTAQPSVVDRERAPHLLYGHLPHDAAYSVGDWLREVAPFLAGPARVILVGGTGLYFTALTQGLAEIPEVSPEIRTEAESRLASGELAAMVSELDAATAARIDRSNPARVRRAWEVLHGSGRGLAEWHAETPPPLLPLAGAEALLVEAPRTWLEARIARRFDAMLEMGALAEAEIERARWDPSLQSAKAIGASELIAHLEGRLGLAEARQATIVATRQFAKRQRTWFRARMRAWRRIAADDLT